MRTDYSFEIYENCARDGAKNIFFRLATEYSSDGKYIFYFPSYEVYLPEVIAMLLIAGLDVKIYFNTFKYTELEIHAKNDKKKGIIKKISFGLFFIKAIKYKRNIEEILKNEKRVEYLEKMLSSILDEDEEDDD